MSRRFNPMPGNPNGGIQLIPPQEQGPVFNVGPLMNDIQLVAMVAATIMNTGINCDLATDQAIEIVAHTLLKVNGGQLTKRVTELAAEAQKSKLAE